MTFNCCPLTRLATPTAYCRQLHSIIRLSSPQPSPASAHLTLPRCTRNLCQVPSAKCEVFAEHKDTRDAPGVSGGQGCCTTRKRKPISNSLINSPSPSLSLSLISRRHFFRHEDHLNNLHFKEASSVMMLLLLLLVRPAPVVTRTRTYRGICLAAGIAFSSFSSSSCCVALLPNICRYRSSQATMCDEVLDYAEQLSLFTLRPRCDPIR